MRRPGEIIRIKKFSYEDQAGFFWCVTSDDKVVRSKRPLNLKEKYSIKDQLDQKNECVVTCVPGGSPEEEISCFELDSHFESELIDYYYEKNGGFFTGKGKHKNDWISQFSDALMKEDPVDCVNPFSSITSKKQKLPDDIKWKTAVSKSWRMPVFASSECNWLTDAGPYHFQPLQQFYYGFFEPACNRIVDWLPMQFNVDLSRFSREQQNRVTIEKKVRIVIHGFRQPRQWHYKFWTHVACASPYSEEITNQYRHGNEERILWGKKLRAQIPLKTVFAECKEYKGHCDRNCNHDRFSRVHDNAKESLTEYLKTAITIFENARTKRLKLRKQNAGDSLLHELAISCRDTENPQNGDCLNLGLSGVCYDWKVEMPTIHLVFSSLYYKPCNERIWSSAIYSDRKWIGAEEWRLNNVSRQ